MSNAAAIEIADALVASLNEGSFSQTFTATRVYDALLELTDATLHVDVAIREEAGEIISRGQTAKIVTLDVGVRQKLPKDTAVVTFCDALMLLKQEIQETYVGSRLTTATVGDAFCHAWDSKPVYSLPQLRRFRQFTGVLGLKFGLDRNMP